MLKQINKRIRGVSMTETLIMIPVFLMITLGIIQYSLIYEAKSSLDYATFMSARAGSLDHAKKNALSLGLSKSLVPLFSPELDNDESLVTTLAKVQTDITTYAKIKILNPTVEAFNDFGIQEPGDDTLKLPNQMLHTRSVQVGSSSRVNLQDANLLKVQVLYGYELKVPFVNKIITTATSLFTTDATKLLYLNNNRLPILATATVRMQTSTWKNDWMASLSEVEAAMNGETSSGSSPVLDDIDRGDSGSTGDDNSDDDGDSDSNNDNDSDNENDVPTNNDSPVEPPVNNDEEDEQSVEIVCESDSDSNGTTDDGNREEDKGFWGDLWDNVKDTTTNVYNFIKGFWVGLKSQARDLIDSVTQPVETAKGLYELAKAFIDDPIKTINAIAEATGQDLSVLVECGAYDRGRILGNYVSPAFMLKLATKLAQFPNLARAIDETKKDLECASFTAGTTILTPDGRLRIEKLKKGDYVNSRNEKSFQDVDQLITNIHSRAAQGYHLIRTEFGVINVTPEHPFWVQGKGWVKAEELSRADPITTIDGDVLVYQNDYIDSLVRVYNFTVDKTHNYFVGSIGVWVHNAGIKCFDNTLPSGTKGGKPRGKPETPDKGMSSEQQRGIRRQNEAADVIANEGYLVEYNSDILANGKNPDLKIEGRYFDVFTPTSDNINQVRKGISRKVKSEQADRIVLN